MKRYLFLILLSIFCINVSGQQDSSVKRSEFQNEIQKLQGRVKILEKSNSDLQAINSVQKKDIDSINGQLWVAQSNIKRIADSLHISIANGFSTNKQTQGQIEEINHTITHRTLYWLIAILLVGIISVTAFFVLRNKLSSSTKNLDLQINRTKETLEKEAIKLDSKLIELLQTQMSIQKEERKNKESNLSETDHKLPLKVGEEIHRMRKRIENMPQDLKGLNALVNSLKRLEEEFNDNGYEIEELLGKKYVDGMKVEARFVDNPDIPKGEEIITEVLRPQITYKGVVVQFAKVEVSKSY